MRLHTEWTGVGSVVARGLLQWTDNPNPRYKPLLMQTQNKECRGTNTTVRCFKSGRWSTTQPWHRNGLVPVWVIFADDCITFVPLYYIYCTDIWLYFHVLPLQQSNILTLLTTPHKSPQYFPQRHTLLHV